LTIGGPQQQPWVSVSVVMGDSNSGGMIAVCDGNSSGGGDGAANDNVGNNGDSARNDNNNDDCNGMTG